MSAQFDKAIEAEQRADLGAALHYCEQALSDPGLKRADPVRHVLELNASRLMLKIGREISSYLTMPRAVAETQRTPLTYASDVSEGNELLPVISFTTIAGRLDAALEMVGSLREQDAAIHSINMYISEDPYLLDTGIKSTSERLSAFVDLGVNIYTSKNIGPYRKQYPCITQLRAGDAPGQTPLITVDDDIRYPRDAIATLLEYGQRYDAVIAHRGRTLKVSDDKFTGYDEFGVPTDTESLLNLANGRNGILYRLRHFSEQPRDFAGPLIAPTADDLWAKLSTLARAIPTVIIEPTAIFDTSLDYPEVFPSRKVGLFHKYNAAGSNDTALTRLASYYTRYLGVSPQQIVADA